MGDDRPEKKTALEELIDNMEEPAQFDMDLAVPMAALNT